MAAARKQAFNRNAAIASIQINWTKISPGGDREERLVWIAEYLDLKTLDSITDLSNAQLGAVAGRMKELTGRGESESARGRDGETRGNVIHGEFGKSKFANRNSQIEDGETVFMATHSPEMIYTIEKLLAHLAWPTADADAYLVKRFKTANLRMLTFDQAKKAVNALLHIATHSDLKKRSGGKPVSRVEVNKYIPTLKRKLGIDR